MKNMPFRYKLIASILVMSLVPLLINSFYSLKSSRDELKHAAFDKLVSVREAKNMGITRYLNTVSSQIVTMAEDIMIQNAARDFISAFKKLPAIKEEDIAKIKGYYTKDFANEYKSKTGSPSPIDNNVAILSPQSNMLQHAFISNNPNPLGSKHLMNETDLLPEYSNFHKIYHPPIRDFLENFGYYDIFIIDLEGNIVYTVFKELDFSTNLMTGPWKDTNLADAFKEAMKIQKKKEYKIVDFKRYLPSYEAPASFISTPIWDGDKKIGVLAYQMPLGTINEIMSERSGLGDTGETYLVGEDKRLRSDMHNDKEFNIYNSYNKDKLIDSPKIKEALTGKPGAVITKNYDGVEVLSSYTKITYPNLDWVIFAELSTKEAFQGADTLFIHVLLFIVVSVVVVIFVSLLVTRNLSNQIEQVVEAFSVSAHDVQNSSQKMDLISNQLYRSVQTQISSITESASAMDEIAAMLKHNSNSAFKASELSSDSKNSAISGKQTMDQMMVEVQEISKSYDDIQKSVDQNNDDINKIINVIAEIARKTKVIDEIVFQTKLLSFNASVEAARAGESGKGFAVVAEEIANLATMSGSASSDMAQMLETSKGQVQGMADAIRSNIEVILHQGRDKVENGNAVAQKCMAQLDSILGNVNNLDASIQEINEAIREQSTGVDEVNAAMKNLENATHETTDMSERSKAAAQNLKDQSHSLRISIQSLRKILGAKKSYEVEKDFKK